jgi:hypothetical protein
LDIWVLSTIYFQKSNISWPRQPLSERAPWYFMILIAILFFWIIKIKVLFLIKFLNPRAWLTLKNSVVIFLASDTYAASLTLAASETSMASGISITLFLQKTSWSWWLHPPWHQNDQYWLFSLDWIIKNPNFYLYLSEAVDASQCPTVSTTPLRQWGFRQCLPFSWTTLRGKHCRHPIAVMQSGWPKYWPGPFNYFQFF